MDGMNQVVTCKHCGRKEIYGRMMWLNGRNECRSCYKAHYEEVNRKFYKWNDLDWTEEELELVKKAEEEEKNAVT